MEANVPELINIEDLALQLGIPLATLYRWRHTGYGPRSAKIGRHVMYRKSDVSDWLNSHFR
jgi:predicted DNA-binding transcriptional regulator AlpA